MVLVVPITSSTIVEVFPVSMAALAVYREARGEPYEVKLGVARVLRNRCADARWPDNLDEVILQPKQFSSFNPNDPNVGRFPKRSNVVDWKAYEDCAKAVAESETVDVVNGANFYHDVSIDPPSWTAKMIVTKKIGKIIFYKG